MSIIKVIVKGQLDQESKNKFNRRLAIALVDQYTKVGALKILEELKK